MIRNGLKFLLLLLYFVPNCLCTSESADDPEECRTISASGNATLAEYHGNLNVAYDGTECLPWSKHPHFYRSHWSNARALREGNYCRNPDDDIHGPWCVVQRTVFKYCNVPRCAQDVGCYEGNGVDYNGDQDRTVDGVPCKVWGHTSAIRISTKRVRFRYHQNDSSSVTLRTTDDRLEKFKSCRNPGGTKSQPWCYTISTTGAKNEKNFCDIPKCSDPSSLGYPLFNNDTTCARGFVRQTQIVQFGEKGERSLNYCVAPHRLFHAKHRQSNYGLFNDFCLYLISKSTHCPAGFRRMQRFLPNLDKLVHVSGPAAWRTATDNLLQCIYCCSDPGYFQNYTTRPYIMMEKITRYKLVESAATKGMVQRGLNQLDIEDFENEMNATTDTQEGGETLETFADEAAPAFASLRRCPPVDGMTRVLYLNSRNLIDTDSPTSLLPPMSDEVLCEYHRSVSKASEVNNTTSKTSPSRLAVFVGEMVCPLGYKKLQVPRPILFLLGASSSLCEPVHTHNELPNTGSEAYCLPVISEAENSEENESTWGKQSEINCPAGFRPNELHLVKPNYRLKLCCSIPTVADDQQSVSSKTAPQAPFGFKLPFGVIQSGARCPTFYVGGVKLNVIQYIRQIPSQTVEKIELIGQDDPVKPASFLGVSICQYLQPDVKLGVKSLTFDCDGLGHRSSMTFSGVTCGFDINETTVFPPGKYCLLQISSECPPGFTHHSGMVRLGFSLQALDSTCCRMEESIGAIQFPVKMEAPFKLPAVHRPCQAIEGFNVDAELHHCVYYPQGSTPQTLLVWPRVVRAQPKDSSEANFTVSLPEHCAIMPRKRKKLQRSQMGRLTTLFFNIMQDQWLIYKRPRWTSKLTDTGDVCFIELHRSILPSATAAAGNGYCLFAFGTCPGENFQTIGASLYMNAVLCCSRPQSSSPNAEIPDAHNRPIHALVTLGHPTPADKTLLRNTLGTIVLPDGNNSESGCPIMANLRLHRRVADTIPLPVKLDAKQKLRDLFNVTSTMDDKEFTERTGIWTEDDLVHIIYCEYSSQKPTIPENSKREWPLANFAIPKSIADCPQNSEVVQIRHRQDHQGFHYSQPIHLDGNYLQGERNVQLSYCVFNGDSHRQSAYEDDTRDDLPAGHYCVIRVRGYCPVGFEDGLLSVLEGPESSASGTSVPEKSKEVVQNLESYHPSIVPDIERVQMQLKDNTVKIERLDYHFCCRADSISVDSPIQGFPSKKGPFYLYRVGDKCQRIEGTRVTEEHICMDAPNKGDPSWWSIERNQSWVPYSVKGLTPARIPFHSHCDVEINLCFYEADIPHPENVTFEVHNTGDWPPGEYALPNVHRSEAQVACPPGFTQHHMSLLNHRTTFFELDIIPMSLGPYFLELIGHNFSAFNVHYCERDAPDAAAPNKTYEEQASLWPKGDYCVISVSEHNHCPPGLHRHTRSIAELCCRNDNIENPTEVEWPFVDDFFMFGTQKCLPIKDTHVERYLVRLAVPSESKQEYEWDVLCHYLPIDWIKGEIKWPSGDYMLPIGRRSGLRTAMINTVDYVDRLTPDHIPFNDSLWMANTTDDGQRPHYKCPDTFMRARFTFVSKASEQRKLPRPDGGTEDYQVVAMTAMEFCVRENETIDADAEDTWPAGDYCVFTMNTECPVGMQAAEEIPLKIPRFVLKSVDIVDEYGKRIENRHWHENAQNHAVYFMQCCREDKSLILRLPPSEDGFYLESSNGLCSRIPGTLLDREKVTSYMTSPLTNKQLSGSEEPDTLLYRELIAQRAGIMYLCYYHPVREIDPTFAVVAEQLATTINVTASDIEKIAEMCGCAKNAFCVPHKQAECICKPGYFGDGRHMCRPITPLTDECANLCDAAATCSERLEGGFRRKKQLLSHACVCRPGYIGDGFTCQPSCATHECQQFSRCVQNAVQNTVRCECIEGTVMSDGRCHLDMYKSIQHEKDLPQFLVHYDNCLSEETQNALRLLQPSRYFYLFVPDELIKTCQDMASHIVVRTLPLTDRQLQDATVDNPLRLITENDTVIEIFLQNGTWSIDGQLTQQNPIRFVNGEMYLLAAPLKRTPHVPGKSVYYIAGVLTSLFVVALLCVVAYLAITRRDKIRSALVPIRGRLFSHQRPRRFSGGSVLVEYTDGDEEDLG